MRAYSDYTNRKKVFSGQVEMAPFADNFLVGVSLIKDWLDAGRLLLPPETIVYKQLKQIGRTELAAPDVREKYFAVNALRFTIGALEKYTPPAPHRRRRRIIGMAA